MERVLEIRRRITDAQLMIIPSANERELFMRRVVRDMEDSLDEQERLPAWLLFARARQGRDA